jgi:predicted O-methyltransferase YrrM
MSKPNRFLADSLREPELLAELRAETAARADAGMQLAPEQAQFLSVLVQAIGARRCLEIGTFTGYSSLAVALALPQARIVCCDVDAESTAVARRYWQRAQVAGRIELRLGPALETLDALIAAGEAGRFDFALIDADKQNYGGYLERCFSLVRRHGLIAIDNTLWAGRVADPADRGDTTLAIRDFNARLAADSRFQVSIVPMGDGLTLALKR